MAQPRNGDSPLILIDGSNWLYRAYFALPPLTGPHGEPTGMIRGFAAMLKKLLKDHAVSPGDGRIAVVFDPSGDTWRNSIYDQYKATRDATPEDLSVQFPHVREWVEAMGLPQLQLAGEEADDVIGTLTRQARARKIPVRRKRSSMVILLRCHCHSTRPGCQIASKSGSGSMLVQVAADLHRTE